MAKNGFLTDVLPAQRTEAGKMLIKLDFQDLFAIRTNRETSLPRLKIAI